MVGLGGKENPENMREKYRISRREVLIDVVTVVAAVVGAALGAAVLLI